MITRNFIFGFICCFFMFSLMGLSQLRTNYGNTELDIEFKNLFSNVQSKQFTILTSTPAYNEFREGEIFIVNSNNVVNMFTRIGNNLKQLTKN